MHVHLVCVHEAITQQLKLSLALKRIARLASFIHAHLTVLPALLLLKYQTSNPVLGFRYLYRLLNTDTLLAEGARETYHKMSV